MIPGAAVVLALRCQQLYRQDERLTPPWSVSMIFFLRDLKLDTVEVGKDKLVPSQNRPQCAIE